MKRPIEYTPAGEWLMELLAERAYTLSAGPRNVAELAMMLGVHDATLSGIIRSGLPSTRYLSDDGRKVCRVRIAEEMSIPGWVIDPREIPGWGEGTPPRGRKVGSPWKLRG